MRKHEVYTGCHDFLEYFGNTEIEWILKQKKRLPEPGHPVPVKIPVDKTSLFSGPKELMPAFNSSHKIFVVYPVPPKKFFALPRQGFLLMCFHGSSRPEVSVQQIHLDFRSFCTLLSQVMVAVGIRGTPQPYRHLLPLNQIRTGSFRKRHWCHILNGKSELIYL